MYLSKPLHIELSRDDTMLSMLWWDDQESIVPMQQPNDMTQKVDYRIPVPADDAGRNTHYQDVNSKSHYLWDTIRALAGAYLPEKAIQFLAPRTLNRVLDRVDINFESFANAARSEDYAELQRQMRRAVQQVIVFSI